MIFKWGWGGADPPCPLSSGSAYAHQTGSTLLIKLEFYIESHVVGRRLTMGNTIVRDNNMHAYCITAWIFAKV